MNRITIISALLATMALAGCGKSQRPSWLGGPRKVPVTPSKSPLSPAPATAQKSKSPEPAKKNKPATSQPATSRPTAGKTPLEPIPLIESSRDVSQKTPAKTSGQSAVKTPVKTLSHTPIKTLTQTDPNLLVLKNAQKNQQLIDLSSMKLISTDEQASRGEKSGQPTSPQPIELETISEHIAAQPQPADEKIETKKSLKLAPLTHPDEQFEADLKGYPNGAAPAFGPTVNPQDAPESDAAPDSARDKLPWNLESQRLAEEEEKLARLQASRAVDELDTAPPKKDRPIVMNRPEVVAGQTLQVNNKYITADDIIAALQHKLSKIPKNLSENDFRKQAARIINRQIIYQIQQVLVNAEAEKYLEDGAKRQVDEEMSETLRDMIALANGSKEKLKQKCLREDTTLDEILKAQRMNLIVNIYLRSKFYPAVIVNRRMLWNYYRKNRSEFTSEKKVQMQLIALPLRAFLPSGKKPTVEERTVARNEARRVIQQAWSQLQADKDFAEVAKRFSRGIRARQGGSWPMMSAGNFRNTEVEAIAFKLAEGAYSKIIETPAGFYIVRAQDIEHGREVAFEQAQEEIEQTLRMEQFIELRADYMKSLYDRATIGQTRGFLILAVDRAVQKYYR